MGTELVFDRAPDLRRIYAAAVRGQRAATGDGPLPDVVATRPGIRVDVEHLARFGEVTGAGLRDTLPLTYPHLLAFPLQMAVMGRRGFPLPLLGSVHVENVITVHREIRFDEALDITVSADNLRAHPKGKVVDLVTEVDVAGERVWEGRSTYLARGKGDADADRGAQPPAIPTGQAADKWSLPANLGRTYGLASGDINPIHMSGVTAKAMGFPSAIAHGMWTYARVLGAIGPRTSGPCTSHVWFKKPVLLPARVDLVVDAGAEPLVAGLRSSRKPETEHLVLTLQS